VTYFRFEPFSGARYKLSAPATPAAVLLLPKKGTPAFLGADITLEGTLRYREVEDEVKGTTFKHRIAEVHATSMKRLSKIEATDDPTDGAGDE
jgi:hypothetical protein